MHSASKMWADISYWHSLSWPFELTKGRRVYKNILNVFTNDQDHIWEERWTERDRKRNGMECSCEILADPKEAQTNKTINHIQTSSS